MNILVMGGTYFLGKAFVEQALGEHKLVLLNRGTRAFEQQDSANVTHICADRHDVDKLRVLEQYDFNVVVDFCAYEKGDIQTLLDHIGNSIKQYVFVSTCDVYRRGSGVLVDEQAPMEERDFGGQAGAYILGKVALESELKDCCAQRNIAYTSIRPVFIYGPNNYAQRESMFFYWIAQAGQIIYPKDADGSFQMVYVRDVARILLAVCGNANAYNQAYNVCGEERLTYETFADMLREVLGVSFERAEITVNEVNERGIPLPFPLTKDESECYDGSKILGLGISYTPIAGGMRETHAHFLQNLQERKTDS